MGKFETFDMVVCSTIALVFGFLSCGLIFCGKTSNDERADAVKAGVAEYYVEKGETKIQFRYLTPKIQTEKP